MLKIERFFNMSKMNISACRVLVLAVLVCFAAGSEANAKAKKNVTARVFIADCLDSKDLFVPINRSSRRTVKGVGGGGVSDSKKCDYSYDLTAMRTTRNRVELTFNLTTPARSISKKIILSRGRKVDLQLEHGVRLIAGL
jgi:hypothetical protein